MKRLALLAFLWAGTGWAEDLPHPFELAEHVGNVFEADGNDGVFRYLESNIRRARASGALTPEWAIVFMMLADSARNTRENAAYALRIADEGLELARMGSAEDIEMAAMLEVSRAYILADLGRFEDATAAAVMALPKFREQFGDAQANDLQTYAQQWSKGELSDFNTSALDVAARVLTEAESALDRGEYGTALTMAARAYLPEDAGIDPKALARSNAKSGYVTGRALYLLDKMPAALRALETAADLVIPDWANGFTAQQVSSDDNMQFLAEFFFWLGRTASVMDEPDKARAALDLADRFTSEPRARNTLLFARAALMASIGQADEAILSLEALARNPDPAQADHAALSGFYAALLTARQARTVEALDADTLFARAEAAIAMDTPGSAISSAFVRGEAAPYLLLAGQTDRALDYARRAFAARIDSIDNSNDSESGTLAAQKATRSILDVYLESAHAIDSQDAAAVCAQIQGAGCVIIRERQP